MDKKEFTKKVFEAHKSGKVHKTKMADAIYDLVESKVADFNDRLQLMEFIGGDEVPAKTTKKTTKKVSKANSKKTKLKLKSSEETSEPLEYV